MILSSSTKNNMGYLFCLVLCIAEHDNKPSAYYLLVAIRFRMLRHRMKAHRTNIPSVGQETTKF